MDDFFKNIEDIELKVDTAIKKPVKQDKSKLPKYGKGERFLKGPIPWKWIIIAGGLPGKALHLAIHIWHIAGMNGNAKVAINLSRIGTEWGFDRSAASRALKVLESSELIAVHRLPGQKPRVTILDI
ncbi:MAG: hypothetical protein V1874_08775 [Spirochaetota bacterium]